MSLSNTEEGNTTRSLVLHVLCPSLPSPNRFTFRDLPLSTTIADLRVRLSESVPSRPPSNCQKLFYLGKLLSDDNVTLQSLFEPLDSSEFSIHLVLPPSPSHPSASSTKPDAPARSNLDNTLGNNPTVNNVESRIHTNHVARLRAAEFERQLQEAAGGVPGEPNLRSRTTPLSPNQYATNRINLPSWSSSLELPRPPSVNPWPSSAGIRTIAPFLPPPNSPIMDSGDGLQLPEAVRPRLRLLKQYITLAEEQLNCGITPSLDHIIQLRTHLFRLLDDQLRQPLSERGEYIEPLVTRVFDISSRADLLRQHSLLAVNTGSSGALSPSYLLSSPSGYQAVLASGVHALGSPRPPTTRTQAPHPQPDANAAIMENVVRQAVLNHRPAGEGQWGLGRNVRRLWLFARLYFFCHMFSLPGSPTRIIYVVLAIIAAILSETTVPRRMYEMVLAPVQRHLEGLVHFTPEEHPPQGAEATGDQAAMNQRVGLRNGRDVNWARLHQNLRRVERSAALFLASLVPGVGERHIEVRNAAEAARNAELARQEEERRRQEEAAAVAQERSPQAGEADAGEADAAEELPSLRTATTGDSGWSTQVNVAAQDS
ncbi:hypothetical protein BJX61DRAFT_504565 [Aspergillus egyptiacus]|nr:hypothetical protein BJX61DRAFT_504565 [Aspergillus egyptiacus]